MSQPPERSERLRTKVFGERPVYDNFWVQVTLVDIETPDGERFEHHVVRLKTVAIAAVLDDQDRGRHAERGRRHEKVGAEDRRWRPPATA